MRFLQALPLRDGYYVPIEHEVLRIFVDIIYRPLLCALKNPTAEIFNSTGSALGDAIIDGTVYWSDGYFRGEYNSAITKDLRRIGATYIKSINAWSLARELVPTDLRFAQAGADQRYDNLRRAFLRTLDDMHVDSIDQRDSIDKTYGKTIDWMEGDFQKSVAGIAIPMKLTETQRKLIAEEWSQNLDLYIKNWASENILRLRNEVQGNTFEGRRSADLVAMLEQNYGVGKRKAKFLARQETSLLLSKFRETRYRDIGAPRYKWSTSHDERVRSDHKHLNGQIFDWTLPPVTDTRTGARNNPGEDFNCRCVAIAIFD